MRFIDEDEVLPAFEALLLSSQIMITFSRGKLNISAASCWRKISIP
jgi:hypothetical protein